jgi:Transposase DDE domain
MKKFPLSASDSESLMALPEGWPDHLIADKGYDGGAVRATLIDSDIRPVIPAHSNRKDTTRRNRRIYRVERMNSHLRLNRAVATGYNKLGALFFHALHIAEFHRCL